MELTKQEADLKLKFDTAIKVGGGNTDWGWEEDIGNIPGYSAYLALLERIERAEEEPEEQIPPAKMNDAMAAFLKEEAVPVARIIKAGSKYARNKKGALATVKVLLQKNPNHYKELGRKSAAARAAKKGGIIKP